MNNKEQLQNPWIEITPKMAVKVLKDDRDIVNSINAKYKNKNKCTDDLVCTTMWPEPFQGNPDAPVYLLNGNPGGDGRSEVDKILLSDPLFRELMIANLCHQSVSGYDDFLYNNILKIDNGKVCLAKQMDSKSLSEKALKNNGVLDGSIWWKKRTKEIRKTIGANPNLFVVEYFPYNSKDSKGIDRSKRLPSYDYSDYLIRKAMEDNKLIVIMRWKTAWFNRIDGLKTYTNLLEISSDSSVFLSSGNLLPFDKTLEKKNRRTPDNKKHAWEKLIDALK